VFLTDVEIYSKLVEDGARKKFSEMIFERYLEEVRPGTLPGISVFDRLSKKAIEQRSNYEKDASSLEVRTDDEKSKSLEMTNTLTVEKESSTVAKDRKVSSRTERRSTSSTHPSETPYTASSANCIHQTGPEVKYVKQEIISGNYNPKVFDPISELVMKDISTNIYPKFQDSKFWQRHIRCKRLEQDEVTIEDFEKRRVLGRGAFGYVKMCVKTNTGKAYALKIINKKRVKANESVATIMSERNYLSKMESKFVICLKYAVMDPDHLYLVLDLREGGDLKFHLNKDELFSEERSRFHAAEVLLGLEHVHKHGIIYRDMKLENILLDERGHCSLSDLGLAVKTEKVRGYAGTPGYTAPEVVSQQTYDKRADFFSYGVMVYRFISGRKPFGVPRKRGRRQVKKKKRGRGGTSELDQNVLRIYPEYQGKYFSPRCRDFLQKLLKKDPDKRMGSIGGIQTIKDHPWFEEIDFGLLEARCLNPPFVPNIEEVHHDSLRLIGRPQDDRFKAVKITPEFEKRLEKFPFKSKKYLQEEIVEVLSARASLGYESNGEETNQGTDTINHGKLCCVVS